MLTNGLRFYVGMLYGRKMVTLCYDISAVVKEAKAFRDKPTLINVIPCNEGFCFFLGKVYNEGFCCTSFTQRIPIVNHLLST